MPCPTHIANTYRTHIATQTAHAVAGGGTQISIYHTYDGLSRRVCRRTVHEAYGQAPYTFLRAFTYDGWNMVQSIDSGGTAEVPGGTTGDLTPSAATAASRLSFVWGPDIGSQTHGHTSWQQAGGVGGLIAVLAPAESPTRCQFPLMDRLGNVMGYRRAVSSPAILDATYEYDAFGREVRSTGPASDLMPYRFSTKYTDADSGLVYYGYRFYDPDRGRWLNRDPIGKRGGINPFGFLGNNACNRADYKGLISITDFLTEYTDAEKEQWYQKFRNRFQDDIKKSANEHCIPQKLLANLIAHEQLEFNWVDGSWFDGIGGGGRGPAQISARTAMTENVTGRQLNRDEMYDPANWEETINKLNTDSGAVDIAARLIKKMLSELCQKKSGGTLGAGFLEYINSNDMRDYCCSGDCSAIVGQNVREGLAKGISAEWNYRGTFGANSALGEDNYPEPYAFAEYGGLLNADQNSLVR